MKVLASMKKKQYTVQVPHVSVQYRSHFTLQLLLNADACADRISLKAISYCIVYILRCLYNIINKSYAAVAAKVQYNM